MKAFPQEGQIEYRLIGNNWVVDKEQGMDLRDYFAAKALQGYLSCKGWHPDFEMSFNQDYAEKGKASKILTKVCYQMADAMMEARNATK